MIVISEADARALVTMSDAIDAMASAFRSVHAGRALSFPLVRERIEEKRAVFGVKSGADVPDDILGLKAGGYWSGNADRGLTNHQSSTVLFDPDTGQPDAFVSGNFLTALRTAAVAGLATRHLARPDAAVMGIIGTGGQAIFQIEAVCSVRPIERLLVAARTREAAVRLGEAVQARQLPPVEIVSTREAAERADVLTSVTTARSPLVSADWISPGTHINAMGADTTGKQELDPELLRTGRVFVDDWTQAAAVGECQHAVAAWNMRDTDTAGTLGALVAGAVPGREDDRQVTVFDSTGMAIQDLAIARMVVERARRQGRGIDVPLAEAD